MERMILFLARHGETEWNRQLRWQGGTDVALNDVGRAQAVDLAERLRAFAPARVHASDLSRARETGEIVAARLGIPFLGADARLNERRFGLFEGLTQAECETLHADHWHRYLADRRILPPGAEPLDEVTRRMLVGVHAIAVTAASGPAVIVGHGSAIRALVTAITGKDTPPIKNGSVFRLEVDAAEPEPARAFAAVERI
jgi:probable phosphoglycerate mutase